MRFLNFVLLGAWVSNSIANPYVQNALIGQDPDDDYRNTEFGSDSPNQLGPDLGNDNNNIEHEDCSKYGKTEANKVRRNSMCPFHDLLHEFKPPQKKEDPKEEPPVDNGAIPPYRRIRPDRYHEYRGPCDLFDQFLCCSGTLTRPLGDITGCAYCKASTPNNVPTQNLNRACMANNISLSVRLADPVCADQDGYGIQKNLFCCEYANVSGLRSYYQEFLVAYSASSACRLDWKNLQRLTGTVPRATCDLETQT